MSKFQLHSLLKSFQYFSTLCSYLRSENVCVCVHARAHAVAPMPMSVPVFLFVSRLLTQGLTPLLCPDLNLYSYNLRGHQKTKLCE